MTKKIKKLIIFLPIIVFIIIGVFIWKKNNYSEKKCNNLEKEISNKLAVLNMSCTEDSDCKTMLFDGNWMSHCVNKNENTKPIESSAENFLDKCFYIGVAPKDIECFCEDNMCNFRRIQ